MKTLRNRASNQPQNNELELSLFGAGIGECLVLHLGGGNWMVVDSCLNADRNRPIALEYLDSIDVDVSQQVRIVLVTHWHDDHIRGVGEVIRESSSAKFACSAALRNLEFLKLVVSREEIKLVQGSSSVDEFSLVFDILKERTGGKYVIGADHWATHGMTIYSQNDPFKVKVHVLSPSAQTVTDSMGQIAKLIPKVGDTIGRFPSVTPNDLSVALLVETEDTSFLLGADLERGGDDLRGWRAVTRSTLIPKKLCHVYKVAHHGSVGADHNQIWSELLRKEPIAILTPYARGRKPLPAPEDIERLGSCSRNHYCSTHPLHVKSPTRSKVVERTMKESLQSSRSVRKQPGHIRIRASENANFDDISVDLFDGAKCLS